ncbi:ABC-F family ATP-binding cassette domain-containing protein [Halobacteriovorax sp. GFR7]|uniref:ABC-F family ATP-binding cassette domain-containing protein n=1 Tax=unclassified Halobacteriovorax TaxID=2639665 RepID=UPI003D991BD8
MSILCNVKNINLAFGQKVIFNNAQFYIEHGDKIGLIGLNGMGKSSLLKIINEELVPDSSTPPFTFEKATKAQGPTLEFNVFKVDQNFTIPNDDITIAEYFYFQYRDLKKLNDELLALDLSTDKGLERQNEIMEELEHKNYWELKNNYESYIKSFGLNNLHAKVKGLSGGEQKKIQLSLGLTAKENLILWDEPTNHLDFETIEQFEDEIMKSNKTHVIISHDRYLLSKVTTKIFHIHAGVVSPFKGTYAEYLEFTAAQEELRINSLTKLKNSLRRETAWMRQGIKARGTRSKKRVENFNDLSKAVQKLKDQARSQLDLAMNDSNRKTKQLVQFKDVSFGFQNHAPLFEGLNLSVFKGDKIGVLGENGVGKSTLMKLVAERLTNTSGIIKRADDLKVCLFSQKRDEFDLTKSPYDLLGEGEDFIHFKNGRSIHVASYFQNFLFDRGELYRPLSSFSGGELNRLQLALNLKNEADIWIFDEPTNDLDIESIEILEQKLSEFQGTVIIISHDRSFLENITNRVWLIENQSVTKFSSGFTFVRPYLEAREIEKSLEKQQSEEEVRPQAVEEVKVETKPKVDTDKIEAEIMDIEDQIAKIDELLSRFDYSNMDDEKNQLIAGLNQKKSVLNEKIEELFELLS